MYHENVKSPADHANPKCMGIENGWMKINPFIWIYYYIR